MICWKKVSTVAESLDVEDAQLPHQHKTPRRFDDGLTCGDFHDTPKAYYCQLYYEAIDNIICSLRNRFDQPGYEVYCKLEELLIKASSKEDFKDPFDFVCQFYKEDFQPDLLRAQLLTFGLDFQAAHSEGRTQAKPTIFDIRDSF